MSSPKKLLKAFFLLIYDIYLKDFICPIISIPSEEVVLKRKKMQLGVFIILVVYSFLTSSCSPSKYPDGLYAELNMGKGQIVLQLEFEKTPMTVANFVGLAEGTIDNSALPAGTPYFDGTTFHRVVPNHVIQAGAPKDAQSRGPGYMFPNEIHPDLRHSGAGMLGMANSGPHTNSSQFYITLSDRSYLDNIYTVFGHVIQGIEVVHLTAQEDVIDSVVIVRIGKKSKQFKSDTESFQKLVTEANQKLKEEKDAKKKREADLIQTNWPEANATESGLKYVVVQEGQGQKPESGATLKVIYSGKSIDGNLAFTSRGDGNLTPLLEAAPFEFIVEQSQINPGINEALADMKKGEKRILILISDLAFGTNGYYAREVQGQQRFVIPPNTTLVYEIEVLDIKSD